MQAAGNRLIIAAMTRITLLVGALAPLPESDQLSGIVKTPVAQALALGRDGLEGDQQGDRRVHGGPEKAVHHYPHEHYAAWAAELGALPPLAAPGGFGENVSTTGMTEDHVAVGDIFRLGTALVQVSQGRQPCWKLTRRFGVPDMARRVQDSGRTGWYYRVLEPGTVAPHDTIELLDRPSPEWTLQRIWRALYIDRMNLGELQGVAALDLLAEGWRRHALRRLESGRVEDWSARLEGTSEARS